MVETELKKSLKILQENKVLIYPTDTVWGIGCDATSENAVEKVFKIKHRAESKSLIILVDSIEMLQKYIPPVPKEIILLLSKTIHPTTIIYNNPTGLAKNVVAIDDTVAIRIVQNDLQIKAIDISKYNCIEVDFAEDLKNANTIV